MLYNEHRSCVASKLIMGILFTSKWDTNCGRYEYEYTLRRAHCPAVCWRKRTNLALEKGWRGFSFSFSRLTFALMSPIISQRALTTALYNNRMCASCVDSSAHLHYFCGSPFRRLPSACHAFLFFHDLQPARRPIFCPYSSFIFTFILTAEHSLFYFLYPRHSCK